MRRILATTLGMAALALASSAQTIDLEVFLTGANSTPPHGSTATGKASFSFDPTTGMLTYDVTVAGMVATVAHVHEAPAGAPGGVAVPLVAAGPNQYTGASVLGPALVTSLLENQLYVNVHSAAFPGGEVRGQIDMPRFLAVPLLDGASSVPPNLSNGTGLGRIEYDAFSKKIDVNGTFKGLTGTVTTAHVHNAAPGATGPIVVVLNIVGTNQFSGTSAPLSDAVIAEILRGRTYINVHSTFKPLGEIRGQIRRGFLNSDGPVIGVPQGGVQTLDLRAGPSHASEFYLLLGSASGTSPGLTAGGFNLPLNFDGYFNYTLTHANVVPLANSFGILDASGSADLTFGLPTGVGATLSGLSLHHAAVGLDLLLTPTFTTNAVPLLLQ